MTDRKRVFLHIGAMKTGTTYLQRVLVENEAALRDAGVQFPTDNGRWSLQVDGVREAMTPEARRMKHGFRRDITGAWARLRAEVTAFPGSSVISMEFMSFAGAEAARVLVEGFEDCEVGVVLGVRDTLPIVPAVWQTGARNSGIGAWTDFLDELTREPRAPASQAWRRFQRTQGIPRMLRVWGSVVPPERIQVIAVPPSGSPRELLWERFAQAIELDPAVATSFPVQLNESLGHASAELVRRVNLRLADDGTTGVRLSTTRVLASRVLTQRKDVERPIAGGSQLSKFAQRWNRRVLDAVATSGAAFLGDPEDLPVGERPAQSEPTEPTMDEVLAAAAFAVEELLPLVDRGRLPDALQPDLGVDERERIWRGVPDPVDAAVSEVVRTVRAHAGLTP